MSRKTSVLILILSFAITTASNLWAWDDDITHWDLSKIAAQKSQLNDNGIKSIGYEDGLTLIQETENETIPYWIRLIEIGSVDEDYATWGTLLSQTAPFYNHFHNPLNNTGLDDYVFGIYHVVGQSSRDWVQESANKWSWQKVRGYYYSALTSQAITDRNTNFEKTFKGLGHIIHLIQDAAQPAHTRNDAHAFDDNGIDASLEYWAREDTIRDENDTLKRTNREKVQDLAKNPVFPTVDLNVPTSIIAPIYLLWDTNQYNGLNPSTLTTYGLAEYSNANFASDDTIFTENFDHTNRHYFPYPQRDSVEEYEQDITGNGDYRTYFRKVSDGETIEHFAVAGRLYRYLGWWPDIQRNFINLDDNCHEDYAQKLIPRAVGYSAGLINYFFRGQIELTPPDRFLYSITTPNGSFQEIRVKAKNITTTGEDMSNGQIHLVVKYKVALEDPFQSYPAPTTPDFYYIVVPEKNGINFIPKDMPAELTFDLSATPIPLWATDVYVQIVYKGQLGSETEAVAVGFKDISEPTPIDIVNGMDYICINGSPYVAGSDEAIAAVDTNGNGKADEWDVFAHGISSDYLKFSSVQSPQNASTTNYNAKFTGISPASYGRVFILTEESYDTAITISSTAYSVNIDSRDTYLPGAKTTTWNMKGIRNQTNYIDGITYIYYPILSTERGLKVWGGMKYMNRPYPAGSNYCDISNMQPDLSGPSTVEIPQ